MGKSNLWDIATKVGGSIFRSVVPGGGVILDVVNEFLPEDKKLDGGTATGAQIQDAIASLPPEQQAHLRAKEFDVQLAEIRESNETLRTMLDKDASDPHSTRPFIAKGCFWVLAITSVMIVGAFVFGVLSEKDTLVTSVTNGWPFVAMVIAPFVYVLKAYFGILAKEAKQRFEAASGAPMASPFADIVTKFLK